MKTTPKIRENMRTNAEAPVGNGANVRILDLLDDVDELIKERDLLKTKLSFLQEEEEVDPELEDAFSGKTYSW